MSLITINYGTFLFWDISLKVCNNACIMPSFVKKIILVNFYLVFLKWTILLIFEDTVSVKF